MNVVSFVIFCLKMSSMMNLFIFIFIFPYRFGRPTPDTTQNLFGHSKKTFRLTFTF